MENAVEITKKRVDSILQRMQSVSEMPKEVLNELRNEFFALVEELYSATDKLNTSNEALLQTEYQLEKEHQRYQELFYFAPDAYLETDGNGKITALNEAASLLFNLPENDLTGKPFLDLVEQKNRITVTELIALPQQTRSVEMNMQPHNRQPFTASISLTPVKGSPRRSSGIRWLIRDVTEKKTEQAALTASEERFHTIFTHSHVGMVLTDLSGRIIESNFAFERMAGYIREELQGLAIEGLIYPEDREDIGQFFSEILEQSQSSRTCESRYLTKNEQEIWARQTISSLPDMYGNPVYFIFLIENITQEKQTDEELVEMKRRMIESIETERLHLAQELHDGPIQDLYGAVFKLNGQSENRGVEQDNIKETQDLIKQVAGTLRGICGNLRPPTLSNFGLDRALKTHIEQIQDQNNDLEITLQADRDDHLLTQEIRLALFRIYQQCMANVLRHSQATQVTVRLEISEEEVSLHVEDNGVGFEPPVRMVDLLRTGHYGLAGISERVESLNGSLMIDSSPGNGARITVEIPRVVVRPEQS